MKVRSSLLVFAVAGAFFWAPGCSSGGVHAPIRIELAPTLDCSQETADFPADLRFFTLEVCPSMGGECALLTDAGGDHGGGVRQLRIGRTLDRRFTVDARIDGSVDYDVTVVGYSGAETGTCTPYALGHALGVRFGQTNLQVRLYPLGGWSCAGTHDGQTTPVTRALHQAVLLPNHEVMILGGIAGPRVGAVAYASPTGPQRLVEVFDPRDARFHAVAISDEDGVDGFSRVMFQARYVSTNADGMYEIHTYGGFDIGHAPEGSLAFDANTNAIASSALFGPLSQMAMGVGAGFRSDAVILYDPRSRHATVTSRAGGTYTTTAASEGAGTIGVVRSIDQVMVAGGRPAYQLSPGWYADGSVQGALMTNRLGATITPISATNFLIWGGDIANSSEVVLTAPQATMFAGEVVSSASMATDTPIAGHDPAAIPDDNRPFTTAYHTATRIAGVAGGTPILFAGGLVLRGGSAPLGNATLPAPSLSVTHFATDGSVMPGGSARIAGRISTVLHTANAVDASATSVLLVGGASQMMVGGIGTTLYGERVTGLVTYDAATSMYAWHPLPDLVSGRWGHTTTIIPDHGVLVVGGASRTDATINVTDSAEFFLWEDLRGMGAPPSMGCATPTDAGMPVDAGRPDAFVVPRDTGPPPVDANVHPVDANVDAGNG